jgi:hypothetical protein
VRQGVSQVVVTTFNVLEVNAIIFKEEAPSENVLIGLFGKDVVFMVRMYIDCIASIEQSMELFESFND